MSKPCNLPCPKCGSMDIYRHHYEAGIAFSDHAKVSTERVDRHDEFGCFKTLKERI